VLSGTALSFDPKLDTPLNRALANALSEWLPKVRQRLRSVAGCFSALALPTHHVLILPLLLLLLLLLLPLLLLLSLQLPVTPLRASCLCTDAEVVGNYVRDPLNYSGALCVSLWDAGA
jgi:hypothetical protein